MLAKLAKPTQCIALDDANTKTQGFCARKSSFAEPGSLVVVVTLGNIVADQDTTVTSFLIGPRCCLAN